MRYESKVDWWIPALLFGGLALATGDWIVANSDEWRDGAALLIAWVMSIWIFFYTYYELQRDILFIRCGPFWRSVSIADIRSAKPTRNPLASMALSLDRIAITLRSGRGVMISPRDKDRFLDDLAKKKAPKGPNCHERTG